MGRKQYFIGCEFKMNGTPEGHRELESCHVTKKIAQGSDTYTELEFDSDGAVIAATIFLDGIARTEKGLFQIAQGWTLSSKSLYREHKLKRPAEFVRDNNGLNFLGGEPPNNFKVPATSVGHPFQYLGMLNHKESIFDLDADLHLVCPIYLNFEELWLDYSNPLAPKIINHEEFKDAWTEYEFMTNDKIIYDKVHFSTKPWPRTTPHGGHTGVPTWIQYPQVPVCPKTGNSMQLVSQLGDGYLRTKELLEESIIPKKSELNFTLTNGLHKNINKMDFWGGGSLYVFFCKQSKIANYVIQST